MEEALLKVQNENAELTNKLRRTQVCGPDIAKQVFLIESLKSAKQFDDDKIKRLVKELDIGNNQIIAYRNNQQELNLQILRIKQELYVAS